MTSTFKASYDNKTEYKGDQVRDLPDMTSHYFSSSPLRCLPILCKNSVIIYLDRSDVINFFPKLVQPLLKKEMNNDPKPLRVQIHYHIMVNIYRAMYYDYMTWDIPETTVTIFNDAHSLGIDPELFVCRIRIPNGVQKWSKLKSEKYALAIVKNNEEYDFSSSDNIIMVKAYYERLLQRNRISKN